MGIDSEFPDFPSASLPAVLQGDGWTDHSWHNDAMPFFVHDASGVGVWVNYPGSDLPHDPQFMAVAMEWGGDNGWQHSVGGDLDLFGTDAESVLVASLPAFTNSRGIAHAFALVIEAMPEIDEIRARNVSAGPGVCASHDFCDANMPMADAFESIMGRPVDPANDDDAALWSAAWNVAHKERLTAREGR